MKPSTLSQFVAHAREKGMDYQTIRMLLLSAGWKEKEVVEALASESLTMPVPIPMDAGSARDAFLHLLAFATLYTTVISLIILAFQYIQKLFPDASESLYNYDGSSSTIRWSMASILVAFPIFLYVSRILFKECALHHEKLASGVRRWLTYLTLFVTAMTMIGDVITLFFFLLDGEMTTRFILKVIAVFLLTGLPFWYYFQTLKMAPEVYGRSPMHAQFRWIAIAVVLSSFVSGFFIVGSPSTGRNQRFDDRRVEDLRSINNAVYEAVYSTDRWSPNAVKQNAIPATLDDVAKTAIYTPISTVDPETGESYEYTVTQDAFELCAVFSLARTQTYDIFWDHEAGRQCFTFDIDDTRTK